MTACSIDIITHALLTRVLIGKRRSTLMAGVAPDLSFYLTYPPWVIAQGEATRALTTSEWPDPPGWMVTLHHASHSLPVALLLAVVARSLCGRWPTQELAAWCLHILVDIPTHSRRFWGPRFLWPLSDVAVDGAPWAEVPSRGLAYLLHWPKTKPRGSSDPR